MQKPKEPYIIVLGTAQDAGYPQANCNKKCCIDAWEDLNNKKFVSCIALVDPASNEQWIFDATPDNVEVHSERGLTENLLKTIKD